MSQRYALISNGVVVNTILADSTFSPPNDETMVQSDTAGVGDT
jgi:hypothetical protein